MFTLPLCRLSALSTTIHIALRGVPIAVYSSLISLLCFTPALGMPEKPEVRAGQATITRPNVGATHIQQGSNAAIIHWQSFNIGAHESVRFTMPNGQAAVLNRVTGNQGSNIYGRLQANGQVYLINRNGIVIGKDARIDTNGFTASTLDVADQDFLDGAGLSFLGDGTAGVTNHGVIRARDGDVLLLGQTVNNTGEISAPNGTVGLAAGTEIRYQPDANQAVLVRSGISSDGADTGVDNSGVIEAAAAELKAAGGSVYELAVNQQGVVRAGAVRKEGGRILLTAAGGTVRQAGKLEARKGEDGGEILVGGSFQGKADPEIDNAARTLVTSEAEIDVSATGKAGDGGTAVVWADESTQFHGSIAARSGADGGKGGDAEVSGKKHLDFQPEKIDLHGVDGRGELLLDPADVDIQSGTTSNAQESPANTFTFVDGTTPTVIDAADVETALAGADVTVQTNDQGSITTTADINWTSASALTLDSGKSISIDGSISGDSGSKLNLNPKQDSSFARGTITQAATSTISVGELAINGETDTLEAAGDSSFNGTLNVDTLRITQNQGLGAVTAENTANQIGTVTVSGSGNLGSVSVRDSNGGLNVNLNDSNSIGWFSFRTVGDLTLNAGSSINWMPNPAEVVFEASGGAFINQAGAGALNLDATNHQAARIYADDLTNTKPGGMSATPIYGETYATLPPTDTSLDNQINYFIYSTATAPVLRFTADNKSRLYGAANPALTYTTTGLVGGDAVSDVLIGGTPTLTCSATATSNVSTYPINNDGSGLTSPKYQLQFDNGALTVNQAPLSVTANNDSITYDATAYSGGNGVTYSGFVNGENSGVLGGTLSYSGSSQGAVNAGSYSIVPGGLSATNYALNYTAGNLTVNPANLTLSATVSNKVYDGSTSASGSATITSGSLFGSDSLSGGSFNFSDANVGNGKNVTVSGVTITDGNSGNNYSVSYNASSADITPAPLTITATDANTVYDGNAYSGGNGVTYSGFVAGEDAGVLGGSLTYSGSSQGAVDVGTYSIVPGGLTANNYAISFVNGLLNISAAPITAITGILIGTVSKVYDGTTTAVLDPSNFQLSGFAAGEGASVSKTSGTYDSPAAGSGKTVMVNLNNTDYTPSGSTNLANYSLPNTISGAVGEITPAPLSVTANNDSKTYDSQAYSGGNGVTYSGFVNNEDNAVLNGTLSYSGSSQGAVNVGTYPITPGGLSAANYSLSFNDGSLAVNPAPLTISANNASKTYDGQAYSGGNGVTYSGFVAGEDASVLGGSLTYGGSSQGAVNAGTYTITPGGLSADNYGLNFVDGVLEIGRAALQVISASLTGTVTKEYDSTVSAVLNPDNFLLRGFVAGDSATVTATAGTYDNPNAGSGKRVTVSLESSDFSPAAGTDLGNYLLPDSASGNIGTITPAPLDLVVADNSRTYGSAELDTPPSATASGLKGDDTVDDLNLIYSYNKLLDEPATNNGRPTPISARLDNGNYVLRNRQSGDLIINKAPLSGQLGTAEREYRDTLNTAEVAYNSVTWTGLVNGDSPLQITLNFTDDIDRSVGTYPLSAEGSAENYLVTLHDGTLKVQPRALSLRLDGTVTKEYDSTVSATLSRDNFNFTNFPAGESAAVTQTAGTYDTPNAGSGKQVTVNLDASDFTPAAGTDLANYVLPASASNNIGTITPAPLDLVVADNSRTYGSTELDAPPSATVSGLKGSDTVADLNLSYAYNTQRYQAATNNGATTPISASLNNGNYVLRDRQNGALTINKAPLRGQIGTVEREYRDTLSHEDVYNSITWTGLLNDDSPLEITFNFSADIQRSVGTYPLSAQAIAENYLVTLLAGSLNIIPRQLRLQIDDASRLYHAPDPAFTYTLEGLPEGVRLEDIGHLRFHSDAELTSATGNYAVHGEIELANTNYAVNETSPGTLTITPRPVTVALRDMRRKGQESIDVNDFIELNGELFEAYNLSLSPQPNSIAQPGRHQIETDFNLASGERPQTVRLDLNTGTRTQQYTNYTVSVEPAMLYYMPEVRQEITYRHNQEGELVATTTKTTTTYTDGTTTKIVTVKGNSTTTTTIDKDGNKMTNFQVTFNMKPLEIKKEQKDSIVISYPPMPDAGNSNDARTLNSATGKQALQASVASMLAELDKKDQDDPALRAYLHSIRDGKLSLSDVLAQAEAGDKTAQAVVMAVMPTVVTELSKRDPDSLTNDERLLLAKVAERVNAKRQRMVEVAEEKFKQHMEDFKASTKHMGMAKVYADPRFPDVLTETMEQVNAEWAAKAAAVTAIGVGAGAAAGVATAAAVGIIFPHAAAALGVAALSTGFVAAAAAGPALLVAGGTILLAVVIVQQIEDGEREAAYNSFMAQNKKRINNTHELIGDGSDAAKAELMSATLQVFAEIYGEK